MVLLGENDWVLEEDYNILDDLVDAWLEGETFRGRVWELVLSCKRALMGDNIRGLPEGMTVSDALSMAPSVIAVCVVETFQNYVSGIQSCLLKWYELSSSDRAIYSRRIYCEQQLLEMKQNFVLMLCEPKLLVRSTVKNAVKCILIYIGVRNRHKNPFNWVQRFVVFCCRGQKQFIQFMFKCIYNVCMHVEGGVLCILFLLYIIAVSYGSYRLWLTRQAVRLNINESDIRCGFRHAFDEPAFVMIRDASHPYAAHERSEMRVQLLKYAIATGLKVFVYDASKSDIKWVNRNPNAFSGYTREHHGDKDLGLDHHSASPNSGDIVVMVDSDYYHEDMPEIIAENICVFYTFSPEAAGGKVKDGVFEILADDRISMTINGGAVYTHPIWNWFVDHVSVHDAFGRTVVLVETRRVSEHRFLVLTVPIAWVPHGYHNIANYLPKSTEPSQPLCRMCYNTCGVVAVRVMLDGGVDTISLSRTGLAAKLILPYCVYVASHIGYNALTKKSSGSIEKYVQHVWQGQEDFVSKVTLLADIYSQLGSTILSPYRVGVPSGLNPPIFQQDGFVDFDRPMHDTECVDVSTTAETRASGRSLGAQIVPGPTLIRNGKVATSFAIDKRIVEPTSAASSRKVFAKYLRLCDLFCRFVLVSFKGMCSPLEVQEVYEHFKKAGQKADCDEVAHNLTVVDERFKSILAFIKAEAATDPSKPQRIISPVSKEHKVNWSQYTIPVTERMDTLECYAFCKTPKEIASRVHDIARRAKHLVMTDFSKFDGTLSDVMNEVELKMITWCYHPTHHARITTLSKAEQKKDAYLNGQQYYTGTSRLSGTPGTALFNSLSNMFVAFCALLSTKDPNTGDNYTPASAAKNLGVYGGDDGMTPNANPTKYKAIAAELGLNLTIEDACKPSEPITFLARTYLSPSSSPGSISDIARVLGKVHLSVAPRDVPDEVIYARKAMALRVTDPDTPILKELAELFARSSGASTINQLKDEVNPELGWNACKALEEPFPSFEDDHVMIAWILKTLDMMPQDLQSLLDAIQNAATFNDFVPPRLLRKEWVAKIPLKVNGETFQAGEGLDRNGTRIKKTVLQWKPKDPTRAGFKGRLLTSTQQHNNPPHSSGPRIKHGPSSSSGQTAQ